MLSILFVCTANQFRSPIAAACLLKQTGCKNSPDSIRVESAGTWTKSGMDVPAMTLKVAKSLGLTGLDKHRTRQIEQELLEDFDLVIVMEAGHKEAICSEFPSTCGRVYLLSEIADDLPYDIPDPAIMGVDASAAGSIVVDLITKGKERILKLAETHSSK